MNLESVIDRISLLISYRRDSKKVEKVENSGNTVLAKWKDGTYAHIFPQEQKFILYDAVGGTRYFGIFFERDGTIGIAKHCLDGPAVIKRNGLVQYLVGDHLVATQPPGRDYVDEDGSRVLSWENGTEIRSWPDGRIRVVNVEESSSSETWYKWTEEGVFEHLDDGYAFVLKLRDKDHTRMFFCYHYGLQHCLDGPAYVRITKDGEKERNYYFSGIKVSDSPPANRIEFEDGLRIEWENGSVVEIQNNGTAHVKTATEEVFLKRLPSGRYVYHNENGPALIHEITSNHYYYLEGKKVTKEEFLAYRKMKNRDELSKLIEEFCHES